MTSRIAPRRIQHPDLGEPEYTGDSFRAIREAESTDTPWVDLNFLLTRDLVMVCTHWPELFRHGFKRPPGYRPDTRVSDLTWRQIRPLRTEHGGYRIWPASVILPYARDHGRRVEFDAKTRFAEAQFARALRYMGGPDWLNVKTMATASPLAYARLAPAHHAGAPTILLCHAPRIEVPAKAQEFIDHYRGHAPTFI